MKKILVVLGVFVVASAFPFLIYAQEDADGVTLPDDFPIFGIPLSLIMALFVEVLKKLEVIKPNTPIKKSLGLIIVGVGGLFGVLYSVVTKQTELAQLTTQFAAGLFIGLGSIGLHSGWKNFGERKQIG